MRNTSWTYSQNSTVDSNVNSDNTGDKDKKAHSDEDEIADEKADDYLL